jgi:hypothetical protein
MLPLKAAELLQLLGVRSRCWRSASTRDSVDTATIFLRSTRGGRRSRSPPGTWKANFSNSARPC